MILFTIMKLRFATKISSFTVVLVVSRSFVLVHDRAMHNGRLGHGWYKNPSFFLSHLIHSNRLLNGARTCEMSPHCADYFLSHTQLRTIIGKSRPRTKVIKTLQWWQIFCISVKPNQNRPTGITLSIFRHEFDIYCKRNSFHFGMAFMILQMFF